MNNLPYIAQESEEIVIKWITEITALFYHLLLRYAICFNKWRWTVNRENEQWVHTLYRCICVSDHVFYFSPLSLTQTALFGVCGALTGNWLHFPSWFHFLSLVGAPSSTALNFERMPENNNQFYLAIITQTTIFPFRLCGVLTIVKSGIIESRETIFSSEKKTPWNEEQNVEGQRIRVLTTVKI